MKNALDEFDFLPSYPYVPMGYFTVLHCMRKKPSVILAATAKGEVRVPLEVSSAGRPFQLFNQSGR